LQIAGIVGQAMRDETAGEPPETVLDLPTWLHGLFGGDWHGVFAQCEAYTAALQGVDWGGVARLVRGDEPGQDAEYWQNFPVNVDSLLGASKTICGKLAAAVQQVEPPPKTGGYKCALSMLDVPGALAGALDVGMTKAILREASPVLKRMSLVDWSMMVQNEVVVDRDASGALTTAMGLVADVLKIVGDDLPDTPPRPPTSPLDPLPWMLDLASMPVGLIGETAAAFASDLRSVDWAATLPEPRPEPAYSCGTDTPYQYDTDCGKYCVYGDACGRDCDVDRGELENQYGDGQPCSVTKPPPRSAGQVLADEVA
jgi:hypothetical protein